MRARRETVSFDLVQQDSRTFQFLQRRQSLEYGEQIVGKTLHSHVEMLNGCRRDMATCFSVEGIATDEIALFQRRRPERDLVEANGVRGFLVKFNVEFLQHRWKRVDFAAGDIVQV